jgi:hypothetical protein
MSRLRVKIDFGYSETLLDLTMEQIEEDVAKVLTAQTLQILTEASKTNRAEIIESN